MDLNIHELSCAKCKTRLIIKTNPICQDEEFRLISCPACHTPIREIRSDKWYTIETLTDDNE